MSKDETKNTGPNTGGEVKKGGYQPLNEGYSPFKNRGYTPINPQASSNLPKPPQGGSGQSGGGNAGKK